MSELLVGIVRRPHGLAGELSVEVVTDFPEHLSPGRDLRWERAGQRRNLRIVAARAHGKRILVSFEGIDTIEAAREVAGGELTVDPGGAAPRRPDFLYSHEIEGWSCEDARGRLLGRARELEQTAAGPMLSVESADGREVLVPFVWPIVVSVNEESRRIVLDPPEGLLEL